MSPVKVETKTFVFTESAGCLAVGIFYITGGTWLLVRETKETIVWDSMRKKWVEGEQVNLGLRLKRVK
jgi:hypothetical protein